MTRYNQEIEEQMVRFFSELNEKERRHYAAVEASRLGYGGGKYICELFGIGDGRLRRGIIELRDPNLLREIPEGMQRRTGGGRKKKK